MSTSTGALLVPATAVEMAEQMPPRLRKRLSFADLNWLCKHYTRTDTLPHRRIVGGHGLPSVDDFPVLVWLNDTAHDAAPIIVFQRSTRSDGRTMHWRDADEWIPLSELAGLPVAEVRGE